MLKKIEENLNDLLMDQEEHDIKSAPDIFEKNYMFRFAVQKGNQ